MGGGNARADRYHHQSCHFCVALLRTEPKLMYYIIFLVLMADGSIAFSDAEGKGPIYQTEAACMTEATNILPAIKDKVAEKSLTQKSQPYASTYRG
jgi:hypothetical protein